MDLIINPTSSRDEFPFGVELEIASIKDSHYFQLVAFFIDGNTDPLTAFTSCDSRITVVKAYHPPASYRVDLPKEYMDKISRLFPNDYKVYLHIKHCWVVKYASMESRGPGVCVHPQDDKLHTLRFPLLHPLEFIKLSERRNVFSLDLTVPESKKLYMKDISTEADSAFINLEDATVKFCGQTFPHQVVKLRLNSELDVIPHEALALYIKELDQHGWTKGEGGHIFKSRARAYQKVELPVSGGFEIKNSAIVFINEPKSNLDGMQVAFSKAPGETSNTNPIWSLNLNNMKNALIIMKWPGDSECKFIFPQRSTQEESLCRIS